MVATARSKAQTAARAPRTWQTAAWNHYQAIDQRDFLCCACPAAGKTDWTLRLARRLLDDGTIQRVVIVAPSTSVRDQWISDAHGTEKQPLPPELRIHLEAVENQHGGHENYTDFDGCALTYAQVAIDPDLQRMACHNRSTLVIFDEIHHAGDEQSWGERLKFAFEHAKRRLGLTGTPWRRPKMGRIPFVTYDDAGRIRPDYEYSYGKAVADVPPVCRVIQFHAYDAQVQCVELELGTSTSVALSDLSDAQDRSHAMSAILDTNREWMRAMLQKAQQQLLAIRTGDKDDGAVPDAQGLVIADNQDHARQIAPLIERLSGEKPELIISDERDAGDALDRFRAGSKMWAVAVNKISEGVNVPSLFVGVYATRKVSPLLFRQIVGRFVRRRGEQETRDAVLFIPAVPDLIRMASEIEDEIRHEIDLTLDEEEQERKRMERPRDLGEPDLEVWEAHNPELETIIYRNEQYAPDEYQVAQTLARKFELPANFDVMKIAAMFREQGQRLGQAQTVSPHVQEPFARDISRAKQKQLLRRELDRHVKAAAYRMGIDIKEMNDRLVRRYGSRSSLSIDQLKAEMAYVDELLRNYEGATNDTDADD